MEQEIQHTENCKKKQAEVAAYETKWPYHCQSCGGSGLHAFRWAAPCSDCEVQNLCPRCGSERVWHDDGHPECSNVGFHEKCPTCGFICAGCAFENASEVKPEHDCECEIDGE